MNYSEAEKLFRDAAAIRSSKGMFSKEAFDMCLESANGGYVDAMVSVGMAYRDGGWGTDKNTSEALKWFTLAAETGDASGIACLDDVYQDLYGDDWENYYVPVMERYAAMGYQEAIERLASKRKYGLIGQKNNHSTQNNTHITKKPTESNRKAILIFITVIVAIITFCILVRL